MTHWTDITASEALEAIGANESLAGRRVVGPLRIRALTRNHLPDGSYVWGPLTIEDCPTLERIPSDLRATGDVSFLRCTKLRELPAGFRTAFRLTIEACPLLTILPMGFEAGTLVCDRAVRLSLRKRTRLKHFVGGATLVGVGEDSQLCGVDLGSMEGPLPAGLDIRGDLVVSSALTELSARLRVLGSLDLANCAQLGSLPVDLEVAGELTVPTHHTAIEKLVHAGSLRIPPRSEIEAIEGLRVGHNLVVEQASSAQRNPPAPQERVVLCHGKALRVGALPLRARGIRDLARRCFRGPPES